MQQDFNNILPQSYDKKSDHISILEDNNIDKYIQICDYKISKFNTKDVDNTVILPGNPESTVVINNVLEDPGYAYISTGLRGNTFEDDIKNLKFQGPRLSSTCSIFLKEGVNYIREFGYIQTSKRFFEYKFEKAIMYFDFHATLLHNQDEVLDSDGEVNPFYSNECHFDVSPGLMQNYTIHLSDSPDSVNCQTLSKPDWGDLVKQERYQQFFVYLVMRSRRNNEDKWKYEVLYSFDWFIYLKWVKKTDESNNILEYNSGLNEQPKPFRSLPKWIDSEEFYPCNQDQFSYWIDIKKNEEIVGKRFSICDLPNSFSETRSESRPVTEDMLNENIERINLENNNNNNICYCSEDNCAIFNEKIENAIIERNKKARASP